MKKISILGLNNSLASTICGPMDIFAQAGMLYNKICAINPSPFFQVEIVSVSQPTIRCLNALEVQSHKTIDTAKQADLIIVASGDYLEDTEEIAKAVTWIRKMYRKGAAVASICTGAFVLAEAGILKDKIATTHWGYAALFRNKYPDITLKSEQLVVDNENVLCSGGVNSYAELCLYLVNKYTNYEVARQCSMSLVLDNRNVSQNNYALFEYQKKHGDARVSQVQEFIENKFRANPTLIEMAREVNLNGRTLLRRFKKATGETPHQYLLRYKIDVAKDRLISGSMTIDEVCYHIGYENRKFFGKVFKKSTGLTPSGFRKKYGAFVN